jgi:hypothetical protein
MGEKVDQLLRLIESPDRHDIPYADIVDVQIAAADERFQERTGKIGLLGHRADEAGLSGVRKLDDLVPLLFAHTTYKSYPESWLVQDRWDRLGRWLETVSTYPVPTLDLNGIADIDDWLGRLEEVGTYVSCSSGTTGKCSMIAASKHDRAFSRRCAAQGFAWGTGIAPRQDFKVMATVPVPSSPRNKDVRAAIAEAFGDGNGYEFPGAAMTIGQVSQMVALRRAITEGTALPEQITDFERISAERQSAIDSGMRRTAEALIENCGRKMLISGQFALLFKTTELIRSLGYSSKDFHPENAMFVGGGLKDAQLPSNYPEFILDTFNLRFDRVYQYYGMQEINTVMPRCGARRYHVPPWLILLLLDSGGDALVPPSEGEAEGRAGFFDLSLDGRWGGVISGDKISVRYGRCDCGHEGPTVGYDIVRYADLGDGDKITCAGTIDAYVRGVS